MKTQRLPNCCPLRACEDPQIHQLRPGDKQFFISEHLVMTHLVVSNDPVATLTDIKHCLSHLIMDVDGSVMVEVTQNHAHNYHKLIRPTILIFLTEKGSQTSSPDLT